MRYEYITRMASAATNTDDCKVVVNPSAKSATVILSGFHACKRNKAGTTQRSSTLARADAGHSASNGIGSVVGRTQFSTRSTLGWTVGVPRRCSSVSQWDVGKKGIPAGLASDKTQFLPERVDVVEMTEARMDEKWTKKRNKKR